MNEIIIEIDINKDKINLNSLDASFSSSNNTLRFKAMSMFDENFIEFEQFRFGFFLKDSFGETVYRGRFPESGGSLSKSYDEFLLEYPVKLKADNSYSLMVYVEEGGQFYDKTKNFKVGLPPRPSDNDGSFESWGWDDVLKKYTPPTPQPKATMEGYYMWDESVKNWRFEKLIDQSPEVIAR